MAGISMVWVWVLITAAFCIGELLTGGLFLLPFALGSLVALGTELLHGQLWLQIVVFIGASLIAFFLLRPFARKITKEEPQKTGINRLENKIGTVTAIIPQGGRGRVRVEREEWSATAPGEDVDLPVETHVEVIRVEGTHLVVRALPKEEQGL